LRVRRTIGLGDLQLVGTVAIADRAGYPLRRARAMARAADLGRELAQHLTEEQATLPAWLEVERGLTPSSVGVA
jgi:hypothetical protein